MLTYEEHSKMNIHESTTHLEISNIVNMLYAVGGSDAPAFPPEVTTILYFVFTITLPKNVSPNSTWFSVAQTYF